MNNLSPHAQRVLEWRESLALLSESRFFEIIRMYLGNIKTPFNKQKLIEELGAFLRKAENRAVIFALLEKEEIELLAAVKFIEKPTREKIRDFFQDSYSYAFIFDKTLNLEERLLVYEYNDKSTGEQYLKLNPTFDTDFDTMLVPSVLLHPAVVAERDFDGGWSDCVSVELLAAFVAFVSETKDLTKADGSFKKRVAAEVEKRFGSRGDKLLSILSAFVNLSIMVQGEHGMEIDWGRLFAFASLSPVLEKLYLCVSSTRLSRDELVRRSRILLGTLVSIPESGYTKEMIIRSSALFIARENSIPGSRILGTRGRFSSIIAHMSLGGDDSSENDFSSSSISQRVIDAAVQFGLLERLGKTAAGEDVFVPSEIVRSAGDECFDGSPVFQGEAKKVLTVDSGLCVRIMPGLSLGELLKLVRFLEIKEYDTAITFELTKDSCMRGFDLGLGVEDMLSLLETYSSYELPQNLRISVDDWYASYSSVSLFHGYVLRVASDKIGLLENNSRVKKYISGTLAPGVYLLRVVNDNEAQYVASLLGFGHAGDVARCKSTLQKIGYPALHVSREELCGAPVGETVGAEGSSPDVIENHLEKMRAALSALKLPDEQEEGLLLRINRKIVLSPEQLKGETVKFERTEAGGMDFSGKLHVIDTAISSSSMLAVEFSNPDESKKESSCLLGRPVAIEKENGASYLRIVLEPEKTERIFEIGRISFVKKIRDSIF
ncbi:MAG: helicase-associated domain-containing protein [Treponema sp.]|nr:helicase-associated domain-containing protein [Treponema sp.]